MALECSLLCDNTAGRLPNFYTVLQVNSKLFALIYDAGLQKIARPWPDYLRYLLTQRYKHPWRYAIFLAGLSAANTLSIRENLDN